MGPLSRPPTHGQVRGPCGTLFWFKLQFYSRKRHLRDAYLAQNTILSAQRPPAGRLSDLRNITKYVSWSIFGFDICNQKLFALKNRLSIVPSLQNIQNIQFLMILMSKSVKFEKMQKNVFDLC